MKRNRPEHYGTEAGLPPPDPLQDAALNWLFTLQAEARNAAVQADFAAWLAADPAHEPAFAAVAKAWELPEMDLVAARMADDLHGAALATQRPHHQRGGWQRAAMGLAAAMLLSFGAYKYPALRLQWLADYQTVAGAQEVITLPDGSRVTLNTGSALALDFTDTRRGVILLQGEAYFDVTPDPARLFRVSAGYAQVEVLGTGFSVRRASEGDYVMLEHGHVEVTHSGALSQRASLEPGESIRISPAALQAVEKADPDMALAWLNGLIMFEDTPFGSAIDDIARYYDAPVVIASGRLEGVRVNGSYSLENPERVIRSLASAAGASVNRLPGGMIILR